MRRHLLILEASGLVQASQISFGPGRPANLWHLTIQGQHYFHDGSEKFALDLFASLSANLSPEVMSTLLNQQSINKANDYKKYLGHGSLAERLEKLVELRSKEGYLAECQSGKDGISWYLNTFHCSISGIAEKFPVVCDQELKVIRDTFPDCKVERVQWRFECGNSCGFQIIPIKTNVESTNAQ